MAVSALFSLLFLFHLLNVSFVHASNRGFSVDLIHRDSPLSPLYDPSETAYDRIRNAARRSTSRAQHLGRSIKTSVSPNTITSEVIPDKAEYLMKFSLGTPPVEILAIADTGSDLTWTQCVPCTGCYTQDAPLFNPKKSSTYRNLSCDSSFCAELPRFSCSESNGCDYSYSYGDQSFTNGVLASDTLTFDSTDRRSVKIPKITIGCGHNNDGTFDSAGAGLVGLGGGHLSLISQLGDSIDGKFSYCLVPEQDKTSILNFGSNAVVSGKGVQSTPIISASPDTFYILSLESITVGNSSKDISVPISGRISAGEGNIIIDSGTTLTILPPSVIQDLEAEVNAAVSAPPAVDPSQLFGACFSVRQSDKVVFPDITFHFSGADVKLRPKNMFVQVADGLVCLATAGDPSFSIFGNLAQMDFLVGYDLVGKKVSFLPTKCATA